MAIQVAAEIATDFADGVCCVDPAPIGMSRMKEAMWKVAPSGDYTFRDRFANQEVIFAELVDTEPLRRHLMEYFRGQAVTIETVITHVIVATPYLELT